jgi:hypothetical protein
MPVTYLLDTNIISHLMKDVDSENLKRYRARLHSEPDCTVVTSVVEGPEKLLAHGPQFHHFRTRGKLICLSGPERKSETNQENGFHNADADLDVRGGVIGNAVVVCLGVALLAEIVEHVSEEDAPAHEEHEHEPMNEAVHVVHKFTVLGSKFRQAEKVKNGRDVHGNLGRGGVGCSVQCCGTARVAREAKDHVAEDAKHKEDHAEQKQNGTLGRCTDLTRAVEAAGRTSKDMV